MKELVDLYNLQSLKLNGADILGDRVTEAGLEDLARFKKLEYLELQGFEVTENERQRLQKALPKLEIR